MIRDDHGISPAARSALGALLDTPMPKLPTHLRRKPQHGFDVAFCGATGEWLASGDVGVDCPTCKAEVSKRRGKADRSALVRLARGPISIREIKVDVRRRLVDAGLAAIAGAAVVITDAGRARLAEGA